MASDVKRALDRTESDLEPATFHGSKFHPAEIPNENVAKVGEYILSEDDAPITCIGLGSCVGIAIWDTRLKLGGLAHAMLPNYEEGRDKENVAKYADSSVYVMVDELIDMGARKRDLRAKVAGGAQMFSFAKNDSLHIGIRNCRSAFQALAYEGVPLMGEDTGGNKGRTVVFYPSTGTYIISRDQTTYQI